MGEGQRHRRLADAAGADEGDKPLGRDHSLQSLDHRLASDHPPKTGRQGASIAPALPVLFPQHRGDEAISAAGDVGDVGGAWVGFGKSLAQDADLDAKRRRLDVESAPDAGEQLVGAHHIALPLEQAQEDVHRPTAEDHGDVLTKQQPFDGPKLERTEKEAIAWSMFEGSAHLPSIPRMSGRLKTSVAWSSSPPAWCWRSPRGFWATAGPRSSRRPPGIA